MEIADNLKKYWPWALGGVVGLFLLSRMGGNGGGSAPDNTYATLMASQAAGAAGAAQLEIARAQIAAGEVAAERDYNLNLAVLEAEREKTYASAATQMYSAQGAVAAGVGDAATGIIGALIAPQVAAFQTAAVENSYAMMAAAEIAKGEFTATALMSQFDSQVGVLAQTASYAIQDTMETAQVVSQNKGGLFQTGAKAATQLGTAYMSMPSAGFAGPTPVGTAGNLGGRWT